MTKQQRAAIQAILRSLGYQRTEAEEKKWQKLIKQMRKDRGDD